MKKSLWFIAIALMISLPAYGWMMAPVVGGVAAGGANPTETLRPDGDTTTANWTNTGEGFWQASSDDSDSSYCSTAFQNQLLIFTMAATSASSGKTIVSVEFIMRFLDPNLTSPSIYYNPNGDAAQYAVVGPVTGSFATYTTGALTVDPVTSTAWTSARLDATFIGCRTANATNASQIADVWAVVTYVP